MKRRDLLKISGILSAAKAFGVKFEFPRRMKAGRGSAWLMDNLGLQLHIDEGGGESEPT